jgi:hypothetical protein
MVFKRRNRSILPTLPPHSKSKWSKDGSHTSPDAKDISIEGDLDAATLKGSYTSGYASLLRMHCSSAEDSFRVPGYGPKWFSDDVEQADTAGKLRQKGYEVLRCQDGFNVVVLSSRQFVYYWSVRK